MEGIRIERLQGEALRARLPDLARLRIEVFRDYPYLYDGSQDYEEEYLRTYAEAPGSVIVGAFDGGTLVGAATALPLEHETGNLLEPFRARNLDVPRIFYFGESVLLKPWRGRGIGAAFFDQREAAALAPGRFTHACFCAVVRPPDHPRRPPGYRPLDDFWRRRGYAPVPGLTCEFSWRDLDEERDSPKPMQFWMKELV